MHYGQTTQEIDMILETNDNWQTPARGDSVEEYQLYLALADDGAGNDILTGLPLKTYDEWLSA
tara:strand:+ start:35 stop:223 length:189 start_codon:yes stop_codon:yes gene_type:complete